MSETKKGFMQLHLSVLLAGFTGLFEPLLLQTAKSLHVSWLPMKKGWLLLALVGLLTACQTAERTPPSAAGEGGDSAAVYQEWAYREMFADSLGRAEQYAYRAFMLSGDSMTERSSLALLSYIYYREGKQQELQLLMQTFSAETYVNMMDVQQQVEQARAGRDRYWYALVILLLLLVTGVVSYWSIRRVRLLSALYRQRTERVRQELLSRASTLTTASVPPAGDIQTKASALPIDETKLGIDVLYAIINDQNVSQMGKQEEQAVLRTLPMVDATLAALLDKASAPLTPKETFFCIMEYYGKSDRQKARSFCCSEQAIRSTKSRLSKKIDIALLRSA